MSYNDEFDETFNELLGEQWWKTAQEGLQLGVELDEDRILTEPVSYENVFDEHIDYANDEKQIQLAIKRLDDLRLELSDLRRRKTRVFNILTEHIEKGLCESDIPIRNGTKEENEQYYEKLLMEFKKKKEAAVKRKHDLNEKININTEYLKMKRIECAELAENQYNLEIKTAVGMVYDKTKEKLSQDDVEKLIESCRLQDLKLNKARLKYILQKQNCKKRREDIENLAPSTFSIPEYQRLLAKNKTIKNSTEVMVNIKNKYLKEIKAELAKIPNINKKMVDLKEERKKNEAELEKLKDEWKQNVEAKANIQKYENQIKKGHKSDCFVDNQLLMNDYTECVEKDKIVKQTMNDLCLKLFQAELQIRRLTIMLNNIEKYS
ncbi:uncharacterized protein LOC113558015 [Rhopalosiphum maidis]|uniref:uncharacterized protein LOC113558015 n=1 Tax=Rhopalosiphum maidis TaxID=43146 RepID=UPI000F004498|nr:uncharacterized protein LOC113558015 [Rhopalosiphum maidis]